MIIMAIIIKNHTQTPTWNHDDLIFLKNQAFAAIRRDGVVIAWGDEHRGGDCSVVQPYLRQVGETESPLWVRPEIQEVISSVFLFFFSGKPVLRCVSNM